MFRPGPIDTGSNSTPSPPSSPIPELGRILFLDTKESDAWSDSNNGASAEALDPDFVPSLSGGVYTFDGSNDNLLIDDSENTAISYGHVFVVLKANDRTKRQTIISKSSLTNNLHSDFEYRLGIRDATAGADGKVDISIYPRSGLTRTITAETPAPDGEFFLAEFELDFNGTLTYRQDGVENGTPVTGEIIQLTTKNDNPLNIGKTYFQNAFDGEMAMIAIYSVSLTADQRNEIYEYAEAWVESITRA